MALASEFRWNDFNLGKIAKHGVTREEAERVVSNGQPRKHKRGVDEHGLKQKLPSYIVYGRGNSNRKLRVVFVISPADTYYVIHAQPVA